MVHLGPLSPWPPIEQPTQYVAKKCSQCGASIRDLSVVCAYCGTRYMAPKGTAEKPTAGGCLADAFAKCGVTMQEAQIALCGGLKGASQERDHLRPVGYKYGKPGAKFPSRDTGPK